ncbi:hypothetical protein AVEN_135506-1 [Araneus ventricosus]|uniref:Uncharacterized protein n=1 Tax=Araneus ventricosus TaxID=182803 RepID=A0A4Y2HPJ7_ARAVE|nr:hypothetical protein AVEN_135506-1 [Araneus ventricosus]
MRKLSLGNQKLYHPRPIVASESSSTEVGVPVTIIADASRRRYVLSLEEGSKSPFHCCISRRSECLLTYPVATHPSTRRMQWSTISCAGSWDVQLWELTFYSEGFVTRTLGSSTQSDEIEKNLGNY